MQRHRRARVELFGSLLLVLACLPPGIANAQTTTVTTVTYVYTNAQGTPIAEADAQGNITARYTYRPYGTQQSGPTNQGPGYTGHVNDPATGLVYMQQRYYDPAVGRFLSPDQVGPVPGNVFNFGRYTYANNNPMVNIDPDGRCGGNGEVSAAAQAMRDTSDGCFGAMAEHDALHSFFAGHTPLGKGLMRSIAEQIKPNSVLFNGTETVSQTAGRINGELPYATDSKNENEPLQSAKIYIGLVRINGTLKSGAGVQAQYSFAPRRMSGPNFRSALTAIQTAIAMKMWGIDPTHGSVHYNMRTPQCAQVCGGFWGMPVQTKSGPYNTTTKYEYIFTYGTYVN